MVLVVLEGATAGKTINDTKDLLEQVAVCKEMTNASDVFQQSVVVKEINIKTHVLEQTTVQAINNTSNVLEQVSVGKEINNINDVCSLFSRKQFKDKACAILVNSTYIVNIKILYVIVLICVKVTVNYAVNIDKKPVALCNGSP